MGEDRTDGGMEAVLEGVLEGVVIACWNLIVVLSHTCTP